MIQPDANLDEEEIPVHSTETTSKPPSQKVVSKSARAKKLLNKKIKMNQHITFDEEGEPVELGSCGTKVNYTGEEEGPSSSDSDEEISVQPVSIDEFEQSNKRLKVGGIKIEEAKELLRSRDKMDRKRERERIRTAHRERRLKTRQQSREEEEEGDGGVGREGVRLIGEISSQEEEEEEEEGVGQTSDLEEANQTQPQLWVTEETVSSDEERPKPKRQKLDKKEKKKKKERKHKQLGTEPEPPNIVEDEELALHLLMS